MPPTVYNAAPVTGAAGFRDVSNREIQDWLIKIAENTTAMRASMERNETKSDRDKRDREKEEPTWVKRLGDRMERGLSVAVSGALNKAQSLASRGMSGTLEQAQQDYAMQQLSRQFAAVMMPVTQAMSYFAMQVERRMAGMGSSEQNRMMGAIIGGGIGYKLGGLPGAILGATAGSGVMGDSVSQWGGPLGAVSGAYAGYRVGGLPGAAIGAGAGSFLGGGGINVYDASRGRGNSKFTSAMLAAGTTFGMRSPLIEAYDLFGDGPSSRQNAAREGPGHLARRAGGKKGDERRDVTPFSAEQTDLGEQASRIQESIIRATAGAGFEDAGPLKPIVDWLLKIYEMLEKILIQGGGSPEKPVSTEAARG